MLFMPGRSGGTDDFMIEWLIAADDFTGALDVAVQFAKNGYEVLASIDANMDPRACPGNIQVLVVDTETRHLPPEDSYRVLFSLTERAVQAGVPNILKKTDSALRGNIGAELEAVSAAAGGRPVVFAPAFPKMNRITAGGIHYIDGVPANESVFGRDPFEPVKFSSVSEIIRSQSSIAVRTAEPHEIAGVLAPRSVLAVNASADADLALTAKTIASQPAPRLAAGCAGLAGQIGALSGKRGAGKPVKTKAFIVISGSVNPIAIAQTVYAESEGFHVTTLSPELKLADYNDPENRRRLEAELIRLFEECKNGKILIRAAGSERDLLETDDAAAKSGLRGEALRRRISSAMGAAASACLRMRPDACHMLVGGDTFRSFMDDAGLRELKPLLELLPGAALSLLEYEGHTVQVVSKSGGFGNERALADIAEQLLLRA